MVLRLSSFPADVLNTVLAGLSTASSAVVTATDSVLTALGKLQAQTNLQAPLDSPTFTGTVTIPAGASISGFAPLASPGLTGTPTTPTAAANTNTTQLASTAYVVGQAASVAPLIDGTATVGTSLQYARQDHIHPTDTTRSPLASPAFTGTPAAPTVAATAAAGTTQLATTAFVRNGTTTNDNAVAGQVGEVISSTVLAGSAVALTTNTAATVTSMSLTAGDWDVWGSVGFVAGATTVVTSIEAWIVATTNTRPAATTNGGAYISLWTTFQTGLGNIIPAGKIRLSLSGTTTVFLGANSQFTTSTHKAYGVISARRAR